MSFFYFNMVVNIYFFILCVKLLSKEKDQCWLNIILTHFAWMCSDCMCLSLSLYFSKTSLMDSGYFGSVHVCCVRFFILHAVSVLYCHQCCRGVMASFKTQFAYFLHIVSGLESLHGSWLSVDFMQGTVCLSHYTVLCLSSVTVNDGQRVCVAKGTSISMSCSTVNAKLK